MGITSIVSFLGAIADPVRLAIVRRLADRGEASLEELATAADVHVNTVRPHLAALEDAGVVARQLRATGSRGRPGIRYRLVEGVAFSTSGFLGLAELLAVAVVRAGPNVEDLRAVGGQWGRYLLGRPARRDLHRDLPPTLERLGFDARVDGDDVVLLTCPCPLVAPDNPEIVCELAAGVVEGVAEMAEGDFRIARRRHDPARRSCRIGLSQATPAGG
jgi:predicted ArsR family transcriptional regulator